MPKNRFLARPWAIHVLPNLVNLQLKSRALADDLPCIGRFQPCNAINETCFAGPRRTKNNSNATLRKLKCKVQLKVAVSFMDIYVQHGLS